MFERSTVANQIAEYLREEIKKGRWKNEIAGRNKLAEELGVHGSTVERALQQLETEGLLTRSGQGKPRTIAIPSETQAATATICVLLYDRGDEMDDYILKLQYHLGKAGHSLTFAPRTMSELKFDPDRIESMVRKQSADAWIVYAGSQSILERFVRLSLPAFALFGRMSGLPIAGCGTDIRGALREAIDCLHEHGHRRIVLLTRTQLVESGLGLTERTFVQELKKRDLPVGTFNLAVWDNTPSGLRQRLDKLFEVTPPTAILVDDWMIYHAIRNYLFHRHGVDHRMTTSISMDYHPSFFWHQPQAVYFYWDSLAVVMAAVSWVKDVAHGKKPMTQRLIQAEFRGREVVPTMG